MRSFSAFILEDHEGFRRFLTTTLKQQAECKTIAGASDGLEGIQQVEQLHPDLILLDIGLPTLNGIEVGRRIRDLSPSSKILFVTQESSAEVVQEAFSLGAKGYMLKCDAAQLLEAVDAVLEGEQFISAHLKRMYPASAAV